jgi:MtN3 and saliva related transmembrane protein
MDFPSWTPTLVGSIGAVCTTGAFVPQVLRVWRLRRAEEISLTTFSVFALGTLVWLIYGFIIDSVPVIAANGATLVLALTIVALKLNYDRAQRPAMDQRGAGGAQT